MPTLPFSRRYPNNCLSIALPPRRFQIMGMYVISDRKAFRRNADLNAVFQYGSVLRQIDDGNLMAQRNNMLRYDLDGSIVVHIHADHRFSGSDVGSGNAYMV